ncbi:oligosaccharide flippase family protein [Bradyrhizobium sp. CCGUVB14]|uniref:oligosaccharide flippase family protein n=1 Tax=Bradyrhizobium sp. CCGUVB14 TaxID=2949628 RepID=UPI0020B22D1C|nr:oligosaccharide flippase family protein [Bradyrhizobium sp. CCGUVB14]MCP3442039.1 oligosaccharide flippase family protein [Bradyrhizobium sp. CCGUVB14]
MITLLNRLRQGKSESDRASLRSRAFRAGSWTLVVHFLSLALRFVGTIILTRIFAPEAFGVLAVVTSVQLVIVLLTDIGLRQAVIQSPNGAVPSFLHTAFTLQIARGIFIWALSGVFAAGLSLAQTHNWVPSGSAYTDPDLPWYIFVASFLSVIWGFQSMKAVSASRNLNVKPVYLTELFAQFVSQAFVILFGWLTHSLWSYIAGQLISGLVIASLSYFVFAGHRDRIGWNREAARELLRFGRWTFLSSTLSALALNGDRLLLGAWLNPQSLGFYSVAYNLASVPDGVVGKIFGAVSFPVLSEAARNQPERVAEILRRMRWITDGSLLAISGFLFAASPSIVHLLYDARYAPAGWMLQYLSLGLIFSRYTISQQAYLALGRPEYLTALSVAKLISLFSSISLFNFLFGIQGAVLGVAVHMLPSCLLMFYFNGRHNLNSARLEFVVLSAWLVGWLIGEGVSFVF